MSNNIGTLDRAVRIIIGLVLIAYAFKIGMPATGWNWIGWLGIIPLVTAFVGKCPLYSLIGVSTRAKAK